MKMLWERFRFYLFTFVMSAAIPSFGAYLAGEKYDDPVIFPACTAAAVVFAGVILTMRYVRERRLERQDGNAEQPGT